MSQPFPESPFWKLYLNSNKIVILIIEGVLLLLFGFVCLGFWGFFNKLLYAGHF